MIMVKRYGLFYFVHCMADRSKDLQIVNLVVDSLVVYARDGTMIIGQVSGYFVHHLVRHKQIFTNWEFGSRQLGRVCREYG